MDWMCYSFCCVCFSRHLNTCVYRICFLLSFMPFCVIFACAACTANVHPEWWAQNGFLLFFTEKEKEIKGQRDREKTCVISYICCRWVNFKSNGKTLCTLFQCLLLSLIPTTDERSAVKTKQALHINTWHGTNIEQKQRPNGAFDPSPTSERFAFQRTIFSFFFYRLFATFCWRKIFWFYFCIFRSISSFSRLTIL